MKSMYTTETDRMLAEGGVMQEGNTVDPVSGNDVPPGAMQEEVRDDIDAKLSGRVCYPCRCCPIHWSFYAHEDARQSQRRLEEDGRDWADG